MVGMGGNGWGMEQRRRVVFFNRFYWPDGSATAQLLTDLAEGLAERGWEVEVVTSRLDYASGERAYADLEERRGVRIRRLWTTAFGRGNLAGRLLDYVSLYAGFFGYWVTAVPRGAVVVVKTDPPLLSLPAAVARRLRRGRFALVSWNQDLFPEVAMAGMPLGKAAGWLAGRLQGARDWSLGECGRAVVLGEDMERFLVTGRGVAAEKVAVIPNWSVQEDRGEVTPERLREAWGIPAGRLVVGYSGNLGRAHDWRTVLAAVREMAEAGERILWLCIGGGHGYEALRAAVEREGLGAYVRFMPYQPREQLQAVLQVADLHWFSLQMEMTEYLFPSKLAGILRAGRPAVFLGKADSEIARLVRAEAIGAAVAEGDARGLVEAIRGLAADGGRRERCGQNSRALWERRFRPDQGIGAWEAVLAGVLEKEGKA